MSEEYIKFKNEVETIVRKCVAEYITNEDKFHFHPTFTTEKTLDLRYGIYNICVIRLNMSSNTLKVIEVIDDSRKYKNGKAKIIKKSIENVAEIENYKDLMLAHLKHYL